MGEALYPKRNLVNESFVDQMDIIDKALIEVNNQHTSYPPKRKQYRFKNSHPLNNGGNMMNSANVGMNGVSNYNSVISNPMQQNTAVVSNSTLGSNFSMDYSAYLSGSLNGVQNQQQLHQHQQPISSSVSTNSHISPVFDPFNSNFGSGVLNLKNSGLSSNIWGNGNSSSISTDATVWG